MGGQVGVWPVALNISTPLGRLKTAELEEWRPGHGTRTRQAVDTAAAGGIGVGWGGPQRLVVNQSNQPIICFLQTFFKFEARKKNHGSCYFSLLSTVRF